MVARALARVVVVALLAFLWARGLVSFRRGLLCPVVSCWGGACGVAGFRLPVGEFFGTPLDLFDLAQLAGCFRAVGLLFAPVVLGVPKRFPEVFGRPAVSFCGVRLWVCDAAVAVTIG